MKASDFYQNYLNHLLEGSSEEEKQKLLKSEKTITMMDVFFGPPDAPLSSPEMKIKALEASRQFERKVLLNDTQHCGVMGELVSEHDTLKDNLADKDKMIL